jgi:hypothetical protein
MTDGIPVDLCFDVIDVAHSRDASIYIANRDNKRRSDGAANSRAL